MITWRVDKTLLMPEFAVDIDTLLSNDEGNWFVTYGFRTHEVQQALYDKYLNGGSLAAKPGSSAHESGLAVDVSLVINDHGKPTTNWDYNNPNWIRLYHKILAHPRLHSLVKIGDGDHIERVAWRQFKDWSKK